MNWSVQPREIIVPKLAIIYKHIDKKNTNWENFRKKILEHNNYLCRYCGGKYQKYLNCVPVADNSYDIICHLCYMITHLNLGNLSQIKIFYSKMDQIEIIKKTVEYIIKTGNIPKPEEIDKNLLKINLSKFEYLNILKFLESNQNLEKSLEFNNYKIFFSQKLNLIFLESNLDLGTGSPLFLDDIPTEKYKYKIYDFSEQEKKLLFNIFK